MSSKTLRYAADCQAARVAFPMRMTPRRKLELLRLLREIYRQTKDYDDHRRHIHRWVKDALKICTGV